MANKVGDWIYDREWERSIALVKKLRLRSWFLENGHSFPRLEPEVECRIRRKLNDDIEATESIVERDLSMWKHAAADHDAA
jgi:hypothetical protein